MLHSVYRIVLALAAAAVLSGCGAEYSWRQKITLEVETPAGSREASSVQEVHYWQVPWFAAVNSASSRLSIRGESVVLRPSSRRNLFLLLPRPGLAYEIFTDRSDGPVDRRIRKMLALGDRKAVVPHELLPPIVSFASLSDPASATLLSSDRIHEHLGRGARLSRVTIEITDEEVTLGAVEAALPWIDDPAYMTNPGWMRLPLLSRRIINRLVAREEHRFGSELDFMARRQEGSP